MPRRLIFTSRALVAAELVLQDLAEQEKSDTTKHSLGEKVGWYSAGDNVAGNNRFILVPLSRPRTSRG